MYRLALLLFAVATTAIWACGGNVVVDPGTSGANQTETSSDDTSVVETDNSETFTEETETVDETETDVGGDTGDDACECACQVPMAEGGCSDLCSDQLNGTTTPNFCEGVAALPMCEACLATNCGVDGSVASCNGM